MKVYNVIEEKKINGSEFTKEIIKGFSDIKDAKYYMHECAYKALDSYVSCIHDNPLGKYTLEKYENRISVSCPAPDIGYNSYIYYVEEVEQYVYDIGNISKSVPIYIVETEIKSGLNILTHSILKAFYDLSDAKKYCEAEVKDYLNNLLEAKSKTISNDKGLITYKIIFPTNNFINITINEIVPK